MQQASVGGWEVMAAAAAVWGATSLAGAAFQGLRARRIDLRGQALAAVLGIAGLAAMVLVMDLDLNTTTTASAFGLGLAVGYGASTLAGYEDEAGEAVARGSAWFLLPWGVSAVAMIWGGLDGDAGRLALGILGMAASAGVGVGQVLVEAQAVRRVSHAWDSRPVPAGVDIVAEMLAYAGPSGPATCPRGHSLPRGGLRFCPLCGEAVSCPEGHPVRSAGGEFCVECGSPLRTPAPQPKAS